LHGVTVHHSVCGSCRRHLVRAVCCSGWSCKLKYIRTLLCVELQEFSGCRILTQCLHTYRVAQ